MAVAAVAKPCNPFFCSPTNQRPVTCTPPQCYASIPQGQRLPILAKFSSSSSSSLPPSPSVASEESASSCEGRRNSSLRYVNDGIFADSGAEGAMVSSASALVSAIRRASKSPVEFVQRIEKDSGSDNGDEGQRVVLPSPDFQRLCVDQLDLFRRIIHPNALLSVYVRPAGSYIMDRLELRRVTLYPIVNSTDIVILVGNFSIPTGLRNAEAALSNRQAEAIPESSAVVFPMVKHPFVVGFLVVELPHMEVQDEGSEAVPYPTNTEEYYGLPPTLDWRSQSSQKSSGNPFQLLNFTTEQRLNAINISRSLAVAYIMDQKAMLLQQTSWQNNVRMSTLVEQMRGPLSSIQTLVKMLTVHTKRSEVPYDIVQDIMVQSDYMRDMVQQLQDAVYLTKANILRFNEESMKKIDNYSLPESMRGALRNDQDRDSSYSEKQSPRRTSSEHFSLGVKDSEMPMPPLSLAPLLEHSARPCNVSDVLVDLVGAVEPLAHMQKRVIELKIISKSSEVAVEEPALRQALGNLIEGALLRTQLGGRVEIVSMVAPAGGALVLVDDDGPDMHYMTQMHSLKPFGTELFAEQTAEDNMTWNFVAGLTVAREILESYGCVVRVISPRIHDCALGTGGSRIEIWLPSLEPSSSGEAFA